MIASAIAICMLAKFGLLFKGVSIVKEMRKR